MSSYRGHLVGGVLGYLVIAKIFSPCLTNQQFSWFDHAIFLCLALLGSLFPDIDTRSTMQRLFFIALVAVLPVSLFYSTPIFIGLSMLCLIILCIPHRSITHNPWLLIVVPLALASIYMRYHAPATTKPLIYAGYFIIGALSHWALDFGLSRFRTKKQ
jgi:hypothetical protein